METEPLAKEPAPTTLPSFPPFKSATYEPAEPSSWLSPGFIIFALLLIGAAAFIGSVKSGKLNLNKFFNVPAPAALARPSAAPSSPTTRSAPAASSVRAPAIAPLKPGAFVVTSISLGQSSFAIINGKSRLEGDPIEAPGVTGWKVKRIVDGAVWVQNGSVVTPLPLSTPGIKPLDDQLRPLN